MTEARSKIRRVRIKSGETPWDTLITDEDGGSLPEVVGATVRLTPGETLAALEFFSPQLDILATVAELDRLKAAEEVCSRATALLCRLEQGGGARSLLNPDDDSRLSPIMAAHRRLVEAISEWRRHVGMEPLANRLTESEPE